MKNADRAAQTRARLIETARALFAEQGFAATGTEAILAGAGVTRGALYHHFADKAALFEAICVAMSEGAMAAITAAAMRAESRYAALEAGSLAWIAYMLQPEVRRILVLEAPTVLGWERWNAIDRAHGFQLLRRGIDAALDAGEIAFDGDAESLAVLLNGAMNAVVIHAGAGGDADRLTQAVRTLLATLRV